MKKFSTVDEYIAAAPAEEQEKLTAIRQLIKKVAPEVEERISYGIPYYNYKGHLVYFGLNKEHIGIYAITKAVFAQFVDEAKPYLAAKGTIRLALDAPLPLDFLKRIIAAQVKENDKGDRMKRRA